MLAELADTAILGNGLYYGELDNDQAKLGLVQSIILFTIMIGII